MGSASEGIIRTQPFITQLVETGLRKESRLLKQKRYAAHKEKEKVKIANKYEDDEARREDDDETKCGKEEAKAEEGPKYGQENHTRTPGSSSSGTEQNRLEWNRTKSERAGGGQERRTGEH